MSQTNNSKREEWANKIEQCRLSGKSIKAWCRENKVVYNTFLGWCNRLKYNSGKAIHSSPSIKTQFIELKDQAKASQGISIEYQGIIIHLKEFDAGLLKNCLAVLRGESC